MKYFYFKSLTALLMLISTSLFSQTNNKLKSIANEYTYNSDGQINYIKLNKDYSLIETNAEGFLNSFVLGNSDVTAKKIKSENDNLGYRHTKYQLYYKSLPVNNSLIIVHSLKGNVISINGDLTATKKPINTVNITEQVALQFALKKVNAKKYKWENKAEEQHMKQALNKPDFTFFPKGDLILHTKQISAVKSSIYYAYKFTIYAELPLYKANIIIDAQTGIILEEQNLICNADLPATVATKYSGTQTLTCDNNAPSSYRLRETARGLGLETYNMQNTTTYSATDFTNATTSWTTVNVDQAARDAHWGAEMTYDYFLGTHSRNSIDNAGFKLLSYVHYDVNYNNAFWDGIRMTYGDGNGSVFTILTALDVCGHEITHGLTENTANLIYSYESGALNESFSDIFGTLIENYGRPTNWDWKIGQDMTPSAQGIRNMSNPNLFSDPDTYLGTFWATGAGDNGGVHTNSGVSNFWFYLLSQGGSGTNDISNAYNVTGISKASAAQIAFRALTVYFTPTTNYIAARGYAIQAAKDIFGNCSNEVKQTTNAWYAVGVGPAYTTSVTSNFVANTTTYCNLPSTVNFNNTTLNANTYNWDFGDGGVSAATNPAHTYTSVGTYTVKLKANGCLSTVDSIIKPSYIVISIPNSPLTNGNAICGSGTVALSASGTAELYWYASPSPTGTPINIGNNYVTPNISSNTTYYVVNTSTNASVFGAPTSSAIGAGGNYNTAGQFDIFDVLQGSVLKSVVVYASVAGNRTIELRNSANALITSTIVTIPAGASTVNLNFTLTPGTGYRLGLGAASAINLYRNSAGAVFPYNIGGLVSVINSSAGAPYFYFFYNWQVQKNSCKSLPIAVTATVNNPPILIINSPTICSGQNVNLNASAATSYTWSTGANTSSIIVNPFTTTTYSLIASNGIACNSSLSTTVTVTPNPTVTVNSATICVGQNANLTATGATSYSWSSGQTTNTVALNPNTTTSYTVYGTDGMCTSESNANIVVNPLPIIGITVSNTIACLSDGLVILSGAPAGGFFSGLGVNGSNFNPSTGVGNYFCLYSFTDSNNCFASDSANIIVAECTGIKTNVNSVSFLMYPNPANNYFIINSTTTSEFKLIVTDALGKLILEKKFISNAEKINISQFAKGIYFIEVKDFSNTAYRSKIIKE